MAKNLNEETRRSLFDLLKKAGLKGKVAFDLENETIEDILPQPKESARDDISEEEWKNMSPSVRSLLNLPKELKSGDIERIKQSVKEGREDWD